MDRMKEKNVYLHRSNAEEVLMDALELVKEKAYSDSRSIAFEDCTEYWKKEIEKIVNVKAPSELKISRIRTLFNIPFDEGDE